METLIRKLKTHDEVIDAIEKGFEGEVSYKQSRYFDTATQSIDFPCGTQFCLFGAIMTGMYSKSMEIAKKIGDRDREILLMTEYAGFCWNSDIHCPYEKFLDGELAREWKYVFSILTPERAFDNLQKFLTKEQFYRLYDILKAKSEENYLPNKEDYFKQTNEE